MKQYLHQRIAGLCAILLASTISASFAWSPTTPFMHVVSSGDKCFFVLRPADYEEREGKFVVTRPAGGIAYQVQDDGSFKKLWSVEGWYALPGDVHLSPDGRTLIHVRDQQEFIRRDGTFPEGESQNVVTIYRDGKPIAGYTAKVLITDMKKGIAWGWGSPWWVDRGAPTRPSIASSELHLVDIIEDGEKNGVYHPLVFQLKTIEGSCFEFDLESGKILARKEKEPESPTRLSDDPFASDEVADPFASAAEQDAGQPATRPESKSEGSDKPQPEAEEGAPVAGCQASTFGKKIRKYTMGTLANTLLFLSTILILLDLSPLDFLPKTKKRRRAIGALLKATNILKTPENGITIKPENSQMGMVTDNESFALLRSIIEQHSDYSHEIDWTQVVGIGYSTISLPVDKIPLPAFRPLYVAIAPSAGSSTLSLLRVGQFEDLDRWITGWRRGPLTWTAVGFLSLGYLLQLISTYFPSL